MSPTLCNSAYAGCAIVFVCYADGGKKDEQQQPGWNEPKVCHTQLQNCTHKRFLLVHASSHNSRPHPTQALHQHSRTHVLTLVSVLLLACFSTILPARQPVNLLCRLWMFRKTPACMLQVSRQTLMLTRWRGCLQSVASSNWMTRRDSRASNCTSRCLWGCGVAGERGQGGASK